MHVHPKSEAFRAFATALYTSFAPANCHLLITQILTSSLREMQVIQVYRALIISKIVKKHSYTAIIECYLPNDVQQVNHILAIAQGKHRVSGKNEPGTVQCMSAPVTSDARGKGCFNHHHHVLRPSRSFEN